MNEPAATVVTNISHKSVAVLQLTITVSVAATDELVTVNDAGVAEPAAANNVIAPVTSLIVTPVVRLVSCVTAPPAPVV